MDGASFEHLPTDELVARCLGAMPASAPPGEETEAMLRELGRRGRPAFEALAVEARSESPEDREAALAVLTASFPVYGNATFHDPLVALLEGMLATEDDDDVAVSIVSGLSRLRGPRVLDLLLGLCADRRAAIRQIVASSLPAQAGGGRDDPRAVAALIHLTRDPDGDVRDWATFSLGTQLDVDTEEVRDALLARLGDEHDDARCEALVGLALRGDHRVVPALRHALAAGPDLVFKLEVAAAAAIADPSLHPLLLQIQRWSGDWERDTLDRAILRCDPGMRSHYLAIEADMLAVGRGALLGMVGNGAAVTDVVLEREFPHTRLVALAPGGELGRWSVWDWMAEWHAQHGAEGVVAQLREELGGTD
jgi:HEAT repeat protein